MHLVMLMVIVMVTMMVIVMVMIMVMVNEFGSLIFIGNAISYGYENGMIMIMVNRYQQKWLQTLYISLNGALNSEQLEEEP